MTRWTDDLIRRVRTLAASGMFAEEIAVQLGVPLTSLRNRASLHQISFAGRPCRSDRRGAVRDPVPDDASAQERVAIAARANLRREIAAARAEMATAPLYKGSWQ